MYCTVYSVHTLLRWADFLITVRSKYILYYMYSTQYMGEIHEGKIKKKTDLQKLFLFLVYEYIVLQMYSTVHSWAQLT